MNTSSLRLVMGLGLVTFGLSSSAEPARPAVASATDYGKGFERLAALGLPDTTTGTYARLQLMGALRAGLDPVKSASISEPRMRMVTSTWIGASLAPSPSMMSLAW